jgi:hypothetical protein
MDSKKSIIDMLPKGWAEKAYELHAITRGRHIKTPEDLIKLVLTYAMDGGSYGITSAVTRLTDENGGLNKNAVYKRIQGCVPWLRWLCENICRHAGNVCDKPAWLKGKRVVAIDATDEGVRGQVGAKFRLHYAVDLFTFEPVEMQQTTAKEGETLTRFNNLRTEDLILADRAYCSLRGMNALLAHGCDYILRYRANAFNLYDEHKNRVYLPDLLADLQEGEAKSLMLRYYADGQYLPIRLCALRKTAQAETDGLKQLKRSNAGEYRGKVSPLQQAFNRYVIVATSIGETIPAETIMATYRLRWEVEMTFKRLKSIFGYDEVLTRKTQPSMAWFYAKLLVAALSESLMNQGRFSPESET